MSNDLKKPKHETEYSDKCFKIELIVLYSNLELRNYVEYINTIGI